MSSAEPETPQGVQGASPRADAGASGRGPLRAATSRFPQIAAQNNFGYTSTTNWNLLNATDLAQYQVVMFLDDAPTGAAQRSAFQDYVANGGGYFGFHVSAFTDNANN